MNARLGSGARDGRDEQDAPSRQGFKLIGIAAVVLAAAGAVLDGRGRYAVAALAGLVAIADGVLVPRQPTTAGSPRDDGYGRRIAAVGHASV